MTNFIYKCDQYFWRCDDLDGNILVTNIDNATIFSEEKISILELDDTFKVGSKIWCEELNDYYELKSKPIKFYKD